MDVDYLLRFRVLNNLREFRCALENEGMKIKNTSEGVFAIGVTVSFEKLYPNEFIRSKDELN